MSQYVYVRLREFLDTLPAGFPAVPSGVELKILKKLFTEDEAELTMQLRKDPEEVPVIAARIGWSESELGSKLEEMAQKGLIFRVREDGKPLYQAFQFLIGIYEFQLKNLDKEFAELFEEYLPHLGKSLRSLKTQQLRVIPVESSLETALPVQTYNHIRGLVKAAEKIAVAECICRKEQGLLGNPCDRPKDTCLMFGDFAQYYVDNGMARALNVNEALGILDLAEESGLVLRPTNTQKLLAVCCCCACCCPGLRNTKILPRPADMVVSYYEAKIDPELCSACGQCVERCQMDAIKETDGFSEIIDGRCIGCGLCVSSCPEEAISLVAKPDMEAPPEDFREALERMESERAAIRTSQ